MHAAEKAHTIKQAISSRWVISFIPHLNKPHPIKDDNMNLFRRVIPLYVHIAHLFFGLLLVFALDHPQPPIPTN